MNSNNPITLSHRGRSVSLNSNSHDSQCFDSNPDTFNTHSRSVSVNPDLTDSDSDFDMISNPERDCLFHVNVVVDFFKMFEKCQKNETMYQTLLETLHQKISDQKEVWISILSSESVTDLYILEKLKEFYSLCESRWNFLSLEEQQIEKYLVSNLKFLLHSNIFDLIVPYKFEKIISLENFHTMVKDFLDILTPFIIQESQNSKTIPFHHMQMLEHNFES